MVTSEFYALKSAPKQSVLTMEFNGYKAKLKRAEKLKEKTGAHSLPPGEDVPVFPVDSLPGCPEDWVRGQGSYVCPVDPSWGLWFDFTSNDTLNTAILASVKGMNPVTGQQLQGLVLEKYVENCPIHKEAFKTGRLCEKCGYKWPPQSYVSSPNRLWWDGFRQPDGSVRQFFFSAEEERDVASAVIGKANTVPAFGFAFFRPKTLRAVPASSHLRGLEMYSSSDILKTYSALHPDTHWLIPPNPGEINIQYLAHGNSMNNAEYYSEVKTSASLSDEAPSAPRSLAFGGPIRTKSVKRSSIGGAMTCPVDNDSVNLRKTVSVAAGARINQELEVDPLDVSEWREKPDAVIRLYFVFRGQFEDIIKKGGTVSLQGNPQGYLAGVPVGD